MDLSALEAICGGWGAERDGAAGAHIYALLCPPMHKGGTRVPIPGVCKALQGAVPPGEVSMPPVTSEPQRDGSE